MLNKKYASFTLFSILAVSLAVTGLTNQAYAVATLTVSPTSGPPGTSVTVTGAGFPANTFVDLLFDTSAQTNATASASGAFTKSMTIPAGATVGPHKIKATFGTSEIPETPFTVTSSTPTITLSPISGPPGSSVTVSGSNFPVSTSITVKFDSATIATIPSAVTSSTSGTFSASFTVPSGSSPGSHTITATGGTSTATATFTVGGTITLSPTTGIIGTTVTITGSGFGASKTITVKFDSTTVTTNPATITTTASGLISPSATFVVPSGVSSGSHTVSATDGTIAGSATFTVNPSATITLTPTSGGFSTSVSISGSGFTASSSITVKFDANTIATTPSSITTSSSGASSAAITIPSTATVGNHTITATDSAAKTSSASFSVIIPATITLSPSATQPNTPVTVSGSSFNPNSAITIKLDSTTVTTNPASLTSTATGTFSATFTVPSGTGTGSHTITATDAVGKIGSATLTVSLGPIVILNPASGLTGTEVSVTGSNFTINTSALIKFGKIVVPTEPPKIVIGPSGTFATKFIVPAGVAVGNHIVNVKDDKGKQGNATFTVVSSILASITLSSTNLTPGSTMTVTGSNFAPNVIVTVKFDGNVMLTERSTQTGTFSVFFSIPTSAAIGGHTISAEDGTKTASAAFTLVTQTSQASISLSPTSATAGASVMVSGTGFAPTSAVTIKLDGNMLATTISNSAGSFTATVNIPLTAAQGSHTVSATDGTSSSSATLSITLQTPPQTEKVTLSSVKFVDPTGASVSRPSEGMQVLIQSDVKNNLAADQQFVYIVQVKDSSGVTVMISWMSGTLPAGKEYAVAQSWLAEDKGSYNVDVFVWQSISNPVVLAPTSKTTITVS